MRVLPLLCALLLMLHGAGGFSLSRGTPQDCERRGGFCSRGSCPLGITRVGICSLQDFCCRRRWYP
ncbi:Gallinacin-5 [Struthio camelus australis]|uniref:Gallinacin-5 n=1 Tax=Struthio camelus australis TaxID=441894 RepID=A0A093HS41_STRCA|nr:Gallinacin-5 [Struthio camelus australis]